MTNDDKDTGFISHLAELRKRLIHSFIFLIIFFVGCYFFAEHIYGFLVEPYAKAVKDDETNRRLIFTALQETFLTYLKVSFFTAFFVTCPYILMQIWKFIAPGLYKHEKIAILPYIVLTPVLFFLGGLLVYYLIMPLAIKFFLSFESSGISTNLPIQEPTFLSIIGKSFGPKTTIAIPTTIKISNQPIVGMWFILCC